MRAVRGWSQSRNRCKGQTHTDRQAARNVKEDVSAVWRLQWQVQRPVAGWGRWLVREVDGNVQEVQFEPDGARYEPAEEAEERVERAPRGCGGGNGRSVIDRQAKVVGVAGQGRGHLIVGRM